MAAARGVMFIKAGPGISLQCPVFLRHQLAQSFGFSQEISKRSYNRHSIQGSSNGSNSSGSTNPISSFGQSRSKRALLHPVSSLVGAKIVYSAAPAFGHDEEGHPECKARVTAIIKALEKAGFTDESRSRDILNLKVTRKASIKDVTAVHKLSYIRGLQERMDDFKCAIARKETMDEAREKKTICLKKTIYLNIPGDTYATQDTYQEALLGAGASLAVVDHVVAASREIASPPIGFALVRPPGHHAMAIGPMGFGVFGNVAVAARHVQRVHGLQRVFIVDFDAHHGNGTNDIFDEDPDVYYLSTHEVCTYPGTGKMNEVGKGRGEGTSLNLPLPGGSGHQAMSAVFDEIIAPAAQRFKPDIILVSAGYDAHYLDYSTRLKFITETYYRLAANLKQLTGDLCGGRCCFFLESGYDLKALSNSVVDSFRAVLGEKSEASRFENPDVIYNEPNVLVRKAIDEIKAIHSL